MIQSHENVQLRFGIAFLDLEMYTFENFRFSDFGFLPHFLKEFLKEKETQKIENLIFDELQKSIEIALVSGFQ